MKHKNIALKKIITVLLVIVCIVFSVNVFSNEPEIARAPEWLLLLHWQDQYNPKTHSLVTSKEFFFSAEGRHDSKAELNALIEKLRSASLEEIAQLFCRFPARIGYIRDQFAGASFASKIPKDLVSCKDFNAWSKGLGNGPISLVFASAYSSAPASLFGHTFIRFRQADNAKADDLRDYAANFSALTDEENENPIIYAWKGLTGGYDGRFTVAPYFEKINEYSMVESRDLWEYTLDLNAQERQRFKEHLWDLIANVNIGYFYLDENCSFHVVKLIEAARPGLDLHSGGLFVLPGETLKAINDAKIVTNINWRPSLRTRLKYTLDNLTAGQRNAKDRIINEDLAQTDLQINNADAAVLDAVAAHLFYQKQNKHDRLDKESAAKHTKVLRKRAMLGIREKSDDAMDRPKDSPEKLHPPTRVKFGAGLLKDRFFTSFEYRVAVHGLTDPIVGYASNMSIETLLLELRVSGLDTKSISVEKLRLFDASFLAPLTALDKKQSWKLHLGFERPHERFSFDVGGSAGISIGNEQTWLFFTGPTFGFETAGMGLLPGIDVSFNLFAQFFNLSLNQQLLWPKASLNERLFRFSGSIYVPVKKDFSLGFGHTSNWQDKNQVKNDFLLSARYFF